MKTIIQAVTPYRDLILEAERYIWKHPETGYREEKTSRYMAEQFEKMGYSLQYAKGIPGFLTEVDTGRTGPTVLVLAELDAVICHSHPESDPESGAVHACGHHAQCAAMLGIAGALRDPQILKRLCGKIRLCVVPAEECLELEYRAQLRNQGIIRYLGGKSEFLSRGYFDGVDLAFMVHMGGGAVVHVGASHVGLIAKRVIYRGKPAHAGSCPWAGKNALYAANSGLNAVNALRETFREEEQIRWHPIITNGGDVVNVIPDTVEIESYLRAATFDALDRENPKINRALCGAALSFGMNVEILDEPGYAPMIDDSKMAQLAKDAYDALAPLTSVPKKSCEVSYTRGGGSTDMGDLSALMPALHAYVGGAEGTGHGNDYRIVDPETACVTNAMWQVAILTRLLENDAAQAKEILENHTPIFPTKEAFLAHQDALRSSGERITYHEDGTVTVK